MSNLNSITFSADAKFEKIKKTTKPIIDFEGFSSNGIKFHKAYKIIDGKIAFEETFEFNILDINSADTTSLQAIDGQEIVFQSYEDSNVYNCTCSLTFGNRIMKSQLVDSCFVKLVVIGEVAPLGLIFLQDIDNLRNNLSSNLTLDQDLDFNDDASYDQTDPDWATKKTAWTTGDGWLPVGDVGTEYTGTFNGADFTISNLFVNHFIRYVGLFGIITNTISNVIMHNIDISANDYIGGLVGKNEGTITKCSSTGSMSGDDAIGGLVGWNNGGTITNCYSMGVINGDNYIGGFVGWNTGNVTNCYSTGLVDGNSNEGGLIGLNSGTITNSYYDTTTASQSDTGKGDPKTTAQMKQEATFTSWNFTTIWDIVENVSYPTLR